MLEYSYCVIIEKLKLYWCYHRSSMEIPLSPKCTGNVWNQCNNRKTKLNQLLLWWGYYTIIRHISREPSQPPLFLRCSLYLTTDEEQNCKLVAFGKKNSNITKVFRFRRLYHVEHLIYRFKDRFHLVILENKINTNKRLRTSIMYSIVNKTTWYLKQTKG